MIDTIYKDNQYCKDKILRLNSEKPKLIFINISMG
jgi:hypothetical protein